MAQSELLEATVSYGGNSIDIDASEKMTVAQKRAQYLDEWNINPESKVYRTNFDKGVEDELVEEDYIAQDGDQLEFAMEPGEKG